MSFWFHRKDKDGKETITSVSVPIPLIMVLFPLFAIIVGPVLLAGDLRAKALQFSFVVVAGFISFFVSKVPQFKRGERFTWGTRHMGFGTKTLYVLGYILMLFGIVKILSLYWSTA